MSSNNNKRAIQVPLFRNTEDAIKWGKSNAHQIGVIEALTKKIKVLTPIVQYALKEKNFDGGFIVATQKQLYREALEAVLDGCLSQQVAS